MHLNTPKEMYERRVNRYSELLQRQERADRIIGSLRLAVSIVAIAAATLMYVRNYDYMFIAAVLAVGSGIFLSLVLRHRRLRTRMHYATLLRDINNCSLQKLGGDWETSEDDGGDFRDDGHHYSSDLDIFGRASLYQWVNTAKTFEGRRRLRDLFLGLVGDINDIGERQAAVSELAQMLTWRQRFLAEGMMASHSITGDTERLVAWAKESNALFRKPWIIALTRICPAITLTLCLTGLFLKLLPWVWPITALGFQFLLLASRAKERHSTFNITEKYADDLRAYHKMLEHYETRTFTSSRLKTIREVLGSTTGREAHRQIKGLSRIISSVSDRRNGMYIIFNTLVLWDFQVMIALERWKQNTGHCLEAWLNALGEIEALASLAVIRFDNPHWVMPLLCDDAEAVFAAEGLGHPLLSERRVCNDVSIGNQARVLLITGSNMSGKSTLLRTVGINLVLAYAGAPVCATLLRASLMSIHTSMRVNDSLGDNISSFYAELLRIKAIVNAASLGTKIFFLLDEVFKGTNSLDRHTGATVLISKLSETNAIGLVSTHDLELSELGQPAGKIANYHFREYYEDGRICFDYKLRPGPSTTRNALHLMKLAGIDVMGSDLRHYPRGKC